MNAEMQSKLQKYMQENGYYNTEQIRKDEGADEMSAKFLDIFGGFDEDTPETESELLSTAKAYNAAKVEADEKAELATALNTPDEALTDHQWSLMVSKGYAKVMIDAGDDTYQGGTYYARVEKQIPATEPVITPQPGDPEATDDGFKVGDNARLSTIGRNVTILRIFRDGGSAKFFYYRDENGIIGKSTYSAKLRKAD